MASITRKTERLPAVIGAVKKIRKCVGAEHSPPCITPKEGSEATKTDAAGLVFLFVLNRKTTPASRSRTLRGILLIARPPLLAVMQGGESARSEEHTSEL